MEHDDAALPPSPGAGDPPPASPAEALLAEYLEREDAGEEIGLDAFCAEHPEHEAELRRLHATWSELRGALGKLASGDPADLSDAAEILRQLSMRRLPFERYRIEGEVAQGGMGAVLRVWDAELHRPLAMKVMLGQTAQRRRGDTPEVDARKLGRFLEEARVTGQLDHPGILPVHEIGLDSQGRVYFTMKLVKGRDLKAIFDLVFEGKEGWSETRAVGVLLKVCEALAYAHSKGVIHRDLKPANVMVGGFGEVYVMDWGLARVLGRRDAHDPRPSPESAEIAREASDVVTKDGDVIGTPAYMPPEQARGEIESVSARSDVYAVGAMLYHLLARRMPYASSERRSGREVLAEVVAGPPRPLREVGRRAPPELVAICEKAMEREPARRYPDTSTLAEDLRAYLEDRVVSAYETGAVPELRKWIARNRALAAACAAAVAALAVGAGVSVSLSVQARRESAVARQKTEDVLSLSAIQELETLAEQADALWPVRADRIEAYDAWLEQARLLVEGRPADPARNLPAQLGLAGHEERLARIRARAKPLTPEQIEADRRAAGTPEELDRARARLGWMRRMLGDEPWPSEWEVEERLSAEDLPTDAVKLQDLAWPLVDPDPERIVYGDEIRGLLLARRALLAAQEKELATFLDTLAWAQFRCARLDEALETSGLALGAAPPKRRGEFETSAGELLKQVESWRPGAGARRREAAELAARVEEIERSRGERRTFEFDDAGDRWWHAQLSGLVADLKRFTDERTGLLSDGTAEGHGWGIPRRRSEAAALEARSTSGPEAKARWDEAVAAVAASDRYGGLVLTPQLGIVPIGEDPESRLWEFAHLLTGRPATRRSDGRLEVGEETGVVLVLIPGGTFRMGAQSTDPTEPNHDRWAAGDEVPVHEVPLDPYFLSKHEMTQAQWVRLCGSHPSTYSETTWLRGYHRDGQGWSSMHPVENVDWTECAEVLERVGLVLPTEAQWERAARGDTESPWWTGDDPRSLAGAANVADRHGKEKGGAHWTVWDEDLDDGNSVHAVVGSYRANPFGLHDVAGNVWEWCRDGYDGAGYRKPARAGDGERDVASVRGRVIRGGSFQDPAARVRSAVRFAATPAVRNPSVGVRPGRVVTAP